MQVNDRELLRRELVALRGGEGVTATKLLASPLLMAHLGRPSVSDAVATFKKVLDELGNGVKARALRSAYGYGHDDPEDLTRRRIAFASSPGVGVGPEALKKYEEEVLKSLLDLLEAHASELRTQVQIEDNPLLAAENFSISDTHIVVIVRARKLLQVVHSHSYVNVNTGRKYRVDEQDNRDRGDYLDWPDCSDVLIHNAVRSRQDSLTISLNVEGKFWRSHPVCMKYRTLEAVGQGHGQRLQEPVFTIVMDGVTNKDYRDDDPWMEGYYTIDWSSLYVQTDDEASTAD